MTDHNNHVPAGINTTVQPSEGDVRDQRSLPRSLCESAVCLLLAVLLFRTFAAEGYMISTGSMAPHLLGYHKRVVCPTCRHEFPVGVAFDTDAATVTAAESSPQHTLAECPNCGQGAINIDAVPRNHGDQLLVFKPAYSFRPPRRWEVIVFRNPFCPTEAYVKRVVGLPGERVQIIDGDVYANGVLCRKDWADQRVLRMLVHELRSDVPDPKKTPLRWQALPPKHASAIAWTEDGDRFAVRSAAVTEADAWSWVEYLHWVRQRGQHETSVKLASWPMSLDPSRIPPAGLKYDPQQQRLSCIGVLPENVRDGLLAQPADESFYRAVQTLEERSHIAPVDDRYGYNARDAEFLPVPVRDLTVALTVMVGQGTGDFAVEMTDGSANYTCVFDASRHQVRLYAGDQPDAVQEAELPATWGTASRIEMSLIDQQVLVAVNEQPVLGPWTFTTPSATPAARYPVRFGTRGLDVVVTDLRLYRDVYYTASRSKHGIEAPYPLEDDELFVLGDNSPVSHDSRRWPDGAVKTTLLVGKPFVVHLPSRPGRLRVGNYEMQLRLPDIQRMQWLR